MPNIKGEPVSPPLALKRLSIKRRNPKKHTYLRKALIGAMSGRHSSRRHGDDDEYSYDVNRNDWADLDDRKERRRVQNRNAQRKFREKSKREREDSDRDARNREAAGRAYSTPEADELQHSSTHEGLPWGGYSMKYMVEKGKERERTRSAHRDREYDRDRDRESESYYAGRRGDYSGYSQHDDRGRTAYGSEYYYEEEDEQSHSGGKGKGKARDDREESVYSYAERGSRGGSYHGSHGHGTSGGGGGGGYGDGYYYYTTR